MACTVARASDVAVRGAWARAVCDAIRPCVAWLSNVNWFCRVARQNAAAVGLSAWREGRVVVRLRGMGVRVGAEESVAQPAARQSASNATRVLVARRKPERESGGR